MIFFDIKGIGRIVFDDEEEKDELKKLEDGKLIPLTEEERKKVEAILYPETDYVELLRPSTQVIINQNENLKDIKDIVIPCIERIEKLIPRKYYSKFILNLRTLQIIENPTDYEFNSNATGVYNVKTNTIYINLKYMMEKNEKNYQELYMNTLIHELLHAASTSYNIEELDSSHCGFTKYSKETDACNNALTEGMTEILTGQITKKNFGSYSVEKNFIKQLSLIINIQSLINSYFNGTGIKELEKGLQKFSKFNIPRKIFNCIETNFKLDKSNECESQNVLGRAQSMMIDIFENKINYEIENNISKEEIKQKLEWFKSCLIDKQLLVRLEKNPDMYQGIDESIDKFQMLEEQFEAKFNKVK